MQLTLFDTRPKEKKEIPLPPFPASCKCESCIYILNYIVVFTPNYNDFVSTERTGSNGWCDLGSYDPGRIRNTPKICNPDLPGEPWNCSCVFHLSADKHNKQCAEDEGMSLAEWLDWPVKNLEDHYKMSTRVLREFLKKENIMKRLKGRSENS